MEPKGIVVSSSPRRIFVLCTLLIALVLPFLNCKKQDQGVEGTVLLWEGDFQCCPGNGTKTPVQREVWVYELTNYRQVEGKISDTFFDAVYTKLVAKTSSNESGYYQVSLDPGRYSLFIREGERFYANGVDHYGNIMPIEVFAGSFRRMDINITYRAAF